MNTTSLTTTTTAPRFSLSEPTQQLLRLRVRCLGCGAVEVPCYFPGVAVDIWNEAQREWKKSEVRSQKAEAEGAGDKLREDAP